MIWAIASTSTHSFVLLHLHPIHPYQVSCLNSMKKQPRWLSKQLNTGGYSTKRLTKPFCRGITHPSPSLQNRIILVLTSLGGIRKVPHKLLCTRRISRHTGTSGSLTFLLLVVVKCWCLSKSQKMVILLRTSVGYPIMKLFLRISSGCMSQITPSGILCTTKQKRLMAIASLCMQLLHLVIHALFACVVRNGRSQRRDRSQSSWWHGNYGTGCGYECSKKINLG